MMSRKFTFCEPHITGGNAVITVSEDQILKYMKEYQYQKYLDKGIDPTDNDLIDDFCIVHWCIEEKEED